MLYVLLMLCVGGMIAIQSPINAALGRTIGVLEGSLFNFLVGTILLIIVVAIFGRGQIFRFVETPVWQWIGGILGATMVVAAIVCVPRIGSLTAMLAMIVGNLCVAACIDHFGCFGLPEIPFSPKRLCGFVAIIFGLWMIMKH